MQSFYRKDMTLGASDLKGLWYLFGMNRGRLDTGHNSAARLSKGPQVDTAVVFVHGFYGNPESTWLNFQTLIDRDSDTRSAWDRCDLFFFGYENITKPVRYNAERLSVFITTLYPMPPQALFRIQVKGQSFVPEVTLRPDFTGYRNLILVGHSEGAVLIRTVVRDTAMRYQGAIEARLTAY